MKAIFEGEAKMTIIATGGIGVRRFIDTVFSPTYNEQRRAFCIVSPVRTETEHFPGGCQFYV